MFSRRLQIALILLILPFIFLYVYLDKEGISFRDIFASKTNVLHIDGLPLSVEVVETPELRTLGLSGRKEIGAKGMLFVFDEPDYHGIWMKDMLFAIDIVWIDESLTIVGIEKRVRPDTYPRIFRPPVPVKYVLETEERYTDAFSIQVGAKVRLPVILENEMKNK